MFEKLRRKLTRIYMSVFSLFLIAFAGLGFYIVLMAFSQSEADIMRELVQHEGEEYVEAREMPVSEKAFNAGQAYSYMLDGAGNVVIDQLSGAPVAKAIMDRQEQWSATEEDTHFLFLESEGGDRRLFIVGRSEIVENGKKLGTLYMFRNLTAYYQAILTAAGIIFLLLVLCKTVF